MRTLVIGIVFTLFGCGEHNINVDEAGRPICSATGDCSGGPACGDTCCVSGEECVDGVCTCGGKICDPGDRCGGFPTFNECKTVCCNDGIGTPNPKPCPH